MTDPTIAIPGADLLLPNALLILAAIDAHRATYADQSLMCDMVGLAVGANAGWVHRHGRALETPCGLRDKPSWAWLSPNGHCGPNRDGGRLAVLLRTAAPTEPPPAKCGYCAAKPIGAIHAGRQLYCCGKVWQWCPDHVPGMTKPEVPPRSRKAHHEGRWFAATFCDNQRANLREETHPSFTSDKTRVSGGLTVTLNRGSGAYGQHGLGIVLEASAGRALVSWPDLTADIVNTNQLITPGAPDDTGLTEHQAKVCAAIRSGALVYTIEDGLKVGRFEGRKVLDKTMQEMVVRGILPAGAY